MNYVKLLCLFLFLTCSRDILAQTTSKNPLLIHSNKPIAFNKVNATAVKQAVAEAIQTSDNDIAKICAVKENTWTFANTIKPFDAILYDLNDLSYKLGLISSTYSNDSTRDAANDENEKLGLYLSNINLNENLYKAIKNYSLTAEAKTLTVPQKKFLDENILSFEKNGMKLSAAERKTLENLNAQLINYSTQFDKNIAEYKDSAIFTLQQLKGVDEAKLKEWKKGENRYVVNINGPNYTELITNAADADTRHTAMIKYNDRAFPKNIKVLDSLLYYRNLLAKTLGFKSYAAFSVVDKMSQTPENVWHFLNDLIAKLTPSLNSELAELKALKATLNPELKDELKLWDIPYYQKKLLDTKYKLNTDEVKEYFEMNNTIAGMFKVYGQLFDIQIKETHDLPVWHDKVRSFDIFKNGQKIGTFYFDLYPRANKYTHFACFPISQYSNIGKEEILPVSALICNFPEGSKDNPSLLNHTNVTTLFHEFGHLVHSMLGRSDLASQGPFNVKGDFVEAPSQFLENWCWEYESLKLFATHYKTGETLPLSLFNKMKATQLVGVAYQYTRQLYLGTIDFTFEDKYDSIKGKSINQVAQDLFTINKLPAVEGYHAICSFTHLNSYAANYYGYLWSKVFAQDMFSVFQEKGVMNKELGLRYRQQILEKGSTLPEDVMLKNFLGRPSNSKAFLKSLGVQ